MRSEYGTHSLRRTKTSVIYRRPAICEASNFLLGHSKIVNMVRYLGIDMMTRSPAENTEIEPAAPASRVGSRPHDFGTKRSFTVAIAKVGFR